MNCNYLLSDTLARIKNAQLVKKKYVISNFSKFILRVLYILKKQSYIFDFKKIYIRKNIFCFKIFLMYRGLSYIPIVKNFIVISKPSRRIFISHTQISYFCNKPGIIILSTSRGIITGNEAKHYKAGGELLFNIF